MILQCLESRDCFCAATLGLKGQRVLICAVVLICWSATTHAGQEIEPNNSATTANLVPLDSSQTVLVSPAKISSLSDLDYFRIDTPMFEGTTTLTATMTPTASDRSLDASISLRDSSGAILVTKDIGGDNVPETLTFSVTGGATYYVVCSSADLFSLGSGDYTLSLSLVFNDPNDQLAEAIPLGSITRTINVPQPATIDPSADVDMYAFTVSAGQRISFNVDCPSALLNASLRIFDGLGNEIGVDTGSAGPGEVTSGEAYLEHTFASAGTFFVGVSGAGNASYNSVTGNGDMPGSVGPYTLTVSPGLAGTIRRPLDSTDYSVDIFRYGDVATAIDPNVRTWIVTHGWNSSRSSENIAAIVASLAFSQPSDQVLTLDWSSAADTGILNPFAAEDGIVPVAEWAAAALIKAGFKGTNLNLVGHSFGSYVSDEIAKRIGGVNSILTFDPAADVLGGYAPEDNDEVNFARDSNFSWSFHSSNFGSDQTPFTADEEFLVTGLDPLTAHGDVLFLFAFLLDNRSNPFSQDFFLSFLLGGTYGPWIPDQFTSTFTSDALYYGYEADLIADPISHQPTALEFVSVVTDTTAISIPEGSSATFHVKLSTQPHTDVTINADILSGDADISIVSSTALTFSTANWNEFQSITLAAATDLDAENGSSVVRLSASGRRLKQIIATEIDRDRAASHPQLNSVHLLDGQFHFTLQGEQGTVCLVDASLDLKEWLPVATNTLPSNGAIEFYLTPSNPTLLLRAQAIGKTP
jgi:hypothetical protein